MRGNQFQHVVLASLKMQQKKPQPAEQVSGQDGGMDIHLTAVFQPRQHQVNPIPDAGEHGLMRGFCVIAVVFPAPIIPKNAKIC